MARTSTVRLRPFHQEHVKEKIRAVHLIKRLQDHADGIIEMTSSQVHVAIKLLEFRLSKALPDIVEANLQQQATAQLQANQLRQMALETLIEQGDTVNTPIGNTYDNESVIDSIQDKDRDNLPVD